MTSILGIALLSVAVSGPALAFMPIGGGVSTHISMTSTALLQKVVETCKAVADAGGLKFQTTVR